MGISLRAVVRATFTAVVVVSLLWVPEGARADPVRGVAVNMWGSDTGYTASMVGTLVPWSGPGGAPLAFGTADVTWGVTSGSTSLGGSCIAGIATHIDRDPGTGAVGFECFAMGHAIVVVDAPGGSRTAYQAYLLGTVAVSLQPGVGATITGLAAPFPIGFPNLPGGWWPLWANQQVVCAGDQPCDLDVAV